MSKELPARKEIEEEFRWNLEDIYSDEDEWEHDFSRVEESLNEIEELQGKLVSSARNLLEGLEFIQEIQKTIGQLYSYAHLKQDQDTRNQSAQTLYGRIQELNTRVSSKTSFLVPEILTLTGEQIEKYLNDCPELKLYHHFLDNILRQKEHYLSDKEEKLLAMANEIAGGPDNIFNMLNNADLTFPIIEDENGEKIRITHGRFINLMKKKDRRVRREAFDGLYNTYNDFINTFATTLNTAVKSHIFYSRARNYDSALESSLDDDNIGVEIYNNLIATVKNNLKPLHKYVDLRQQTLPVEELHIYDLYVPLVAEIEDKIPYSEARKKIISGLKPLGDDYLKVLKEGFNSGWIDVYENKGKRSGAYSSGTYGVHPFVLMNYTGDFGDMFTLAHEMGHALHTYYSHKHQPFVYASYKIFVAEVASTVNETLLLHHLLNTSENQKMKMYLLNYYLEQFRGTVYRQTMFAEFEKIIHQKVEAGAPLTAEYLNNIYRKLNREYYGGNIVLDEVTNSEWARIPHFYYNFYVYKYATGFSAATALAEKIIAGDKNAVNSYLDFLKSGSSDYPLNLLRNAGVDMNSPEPVKTATQKFNDYLNRLKSLLQEEK
ncbi:MAG: oligoendopeptidase F [Halanaerobiaceae bacterium]